MTFTHKVGPTFADHTPQEVLPGVTFTDTSEQWKLVVYVDSYKLSMVFDTIEEALQAKQVLDQDQNPISYHAMGISSIPRR